jgi:hypothetical protein
VGPTRNTVAAVSCTLAVLGAVLLAGCGEQREAVAPACFGPPASLLSTLRAGPPIALDGETRLSSCVSSARSDGDLQSLGLLFVRVADVLRAEAGSDPDAAFALGYLAGAVTRGATGSSGAIAAQLARRVEQVSTLDPGAGTASVAALARGRSAGRRDG